MFKYLLPFIFVGTVANAADLDKVISGSVGAGLSYAYVEMIAPERNDLKKHALVGGLISTFSNWKYGVAAGIGKELIYDGLLRKGEVQIEDALVTSLSSGLSGLLCEDFSPEFRSEDGELKIGFRYSFKF
jgi:hypothetical protein